MTSLYNTFNEETLWQQVLKDQGEIFYTVKGLPFSYHVKIGKNGNPTGELLIDRKESSKTLTKSSLTLAFRKVCEARNDSDEKPFFKGPKAIGQIFGISYIYSMFWKWDLINVPENTKKHLTGFSEN